MYYEGDGAIITSKCIITVLLSLLGDNTVGGGEGKLLYSEYRKLSLILLWFVVLPEHKHTTEEGDTLHRKRAVPASVPYTWLASNVSVVASKWWSGTFDVLVITYGWQSSVKVNLS